MSRESRLELLKRIQELRDSNVLVYFTGDRQPTQAAIAEDAVRPLNLPPGFDPTQLPANVQQLLQQMLNQIAQGISQIVQQEIARQSPVIGIEGRIYDAKWIEKTGNMA